jgi:mannose-1-phosphate guanylyltransferase
VSEAVVLVGGQGTRLRPLTETIPKPLLPVAGVPFLQHQFVVAREAGITRVVLATSYRAELFEEAFGDGSALGLELVYVTEDEPQGTGGAIRNVAHALRSAPGEPVVILNGDILSGHDLAAQLDHHRSTGADVTLHLVKVEDARAFGCVPTDADGRVSAFLEKMPEPISDQINAGCYVFDRAVIDAIPAGRPVSVERETFPGLLEAGANVQGYVQTAYWLDLGTPAAYVKGSADLVRGALSGPAVPAHEGDALVLEGAQVDPTAVLADGTVVGRDAIVEAGAVVRGSVLQDGVRIGVDARVTGAALARGAQVGAKAVLDATVVGENGVVGDGCTLGAVLVACDEQVPAGQTREP